MYAFPGLNGLCRTVLARSYQVPAHIQLPPYLSPGWRSPISSNPGELIGMANIPFLLEAERDLMRAAGKLARKTLDFAGSMVAPGVTTEEIDSATREFIFSNGAYPSPLNYPGPDPESELGAYPKSICTSVNDVCGHGIPNNIALVDGDIVSVDVTVYLNGYHGDCCATYFVGEGHDEATKDLVAVNKEALRKAANICGPGVDFCTIGYIIEEYVGKKGYIVFKEFVGHGIGRHFHNWPFVMHTANNAEGFMKPGMAFTIEPIIKRGPSDEYVANGWELRSKDGLWSAQHEHTILITDDGAEILTREEQN